MSRNKFIDDECERGSDDNSSDDEGAEEENDSDRAFIDDSPEIEEHRRVRLDPSEYELTDDDRELIAEASKPKRRCVRVQDSSDSEDSCDSFISHDSDEYVSLAEEFRKASRRPVKKAVALKPAKTFQAQVESVEAEPVSKPNGKRVAFSYPERNVIPFRVPAKPPVHKLDWKFLNGSQTSGSKGRKVSKTKPKKKT